MSGMRHMVLSYMVLIMVSVHALHKTSRDSIQALYTHALEGKAVHRQLELYTRAIQRHLKNNEIQKENHLEQFLLAAAYGTVESIQSFIDAGFSIQACNKNQRTPLMMAAFCGNVDVVQFLLHKGASPSAMDANGNAVLWYAKKVPNLIDEGSLTDAVLCAPLFMLATSRYTKEDPYDKCIALITAALEKQAAANFTARDYREPVEINNLKGE